MKPLLTYDDGRLKTGRVALLVFLIIMVGCTIAYKLSKPVDQVMVAVKHVFEAEPVEPPSPETSAEESAVPEQKKSDATAQAEKKLDAKQEQEAGQKAEKSQKPAEEKAAVQQPATPPVAEIEKQPADQGAAAAPGPEKPDSDSATSPVPDPVKVAQAEQPVKETPSPETAPLMVGKEATQPIKLSSIPTTGSHEKKETAGEVTLATSDYMGVYQSWKKVGEQGGGGNIPLRIKNLENVYTLFQMKVVALVDGEPYADLSDGSRIAPAALDVYASTCFVVTNPFEKFNDALVKAGLRNKRVEVRYYMYDSVRNSIYARANLAVACCREKGLIPADMASASVDLLGRSYAIRKKGGGGFGVFVPTRIDLSDGRSVPVDPSCFKGSQDIDHLIAAGLLK